MRAIPPPWSELLDWRGDLRLALGFLTRLPVPRPAEAAPGNLARAAWAFPVVGIVVGLLSSIAFAVALALGLPVLPAALLALGTGILLTGGLHEDGLADTADGLGGGAGREEKLAIMRDSRSGAYGVLALVFSVGLRASALAAIGEAGRVTAALIAAHAAARGFLPLVLRFVSPARADGLGASAGRPEPVFAWAAAGLGALTVLIALHPFAGIAALLVTAAAMALLVAAAQRQIGGYTGDVLGALEQTGEIVLLLAAAAWAS